MVVTRQLVSTYGFIFDARQPCKPEVVRVRGGPHGVFMGQHQECILVMKSTWELYSIPITIGLIMM